MSAPTIWARGVAPGQRGPHAPECSCKGHCRWCSRDLKAASDAWLHLILAGQVPAWPYMGPRDRYCSRQCRQDYRAGSRRRLLRALRLRRP